MLPLFLCACYQHTVFNWYMWSLKLRVFLSCLILQRTSRGSQKKMYNKSMLGYEWKWGLNTRGGMLLIPLRASLTSAHPVPVSSQRRGTVGVDGEPCRCGSKRRRKCASASSEPLGLHQPWGLRALAASGVSLWKAPCSVLLSPVWDGLRKSRIAAERPSPSTTTSLLTQHSTGRAHLW